MERLKKLEFTNDLVFDMLGEDKFEIGAWDTSMACDHAITELDLIFNIKRMLKVLKKEQKELDYKKELYYKRTLKMGPPMPPIPGFKPEEILEYVGEYIREGYEYIDVIENEIQFEILCGQPIEWNLVWDMFFRKDLGEETIFRQFLTKYRNPLEGVK